MIDALRFVDGIEDNVPYDLNSDFCDYIFNEKHIDYILHGDDTCLNAEGKDAYEEPKRRHKMKIIKRTEGISTTDVIGRIIKATDRNYVSPKHENRKMIKMLPTLWRYIEFSGGKRKPNVYLYNIIAR